MLLVTVFLVTRGHGVSVSHGGKNSKTRENEKIATCGRFWYNAAEVRIMSNVTYLETGSTDPAYNLAFEEYVLTHRTQGDYLLLWQNDNTVVVGRNQNTAEEIDADAEDAVRWAYASDLLTEKDGKLRVQEELSRKELSRMLEDLLALSSAD